MAVVAVIALGALAAVIWSQWRREPFYVSGYIEADEMRVGSRVGGRVAEVAIVEGETVSAGTVLVRLDPFDLTERLRGAEAELAAREAQSAKLKAGYREEEVAQARARREQAAAVLEKLEAGQRPLEIQILEDRLAVYEAELAKAKSDFERVRQLHDQGRAASEEFDDVTRTLAVAEARRAQAKDELDLAREGTRAEELAEARAALAEATAVVALYEKGYRPEEIAQAEAEAAAGRAHVAAARRQLDELEVRAPLDCVVEAVDLQPGDMVAPNAPVLSLLDAGHLWVRAYVPENRLDVRVGQKVSIAVDAFPERRFTGRISFVARQAEFTPSNVQTREERSKQVFRIRVELEEGRDVLRAGMAADVYLGGEK